MRHIDKFTSSASQSYTLVGEDGEEIGLALKFLPRQNRWLCNISYDGKTLNGILLTVSPNIIRNMQNLWPFGIAVTSTDSLDPFYLDDFITGRIKFYLLNAADVLAIEESLYI